MSIIHAFPALAALLWAASSASAQPSSSALQASNALNPNISAVGWLQGQAGRADGAAFDVKEVELAVQSVVDPYAKADLFLAFDGEGVEVEEAALSWYALPVGLKAGKFRANFGSFNRIHGPETPFADRPLVHERYLGAESLASTGLSLNWHVPNPWIFLGLDLEATAPPEEGPMFGRTVNRDLLYVSRLRAYADLSDSLNASLGGSLAYGPAEIAYDPPTASSVTLWSRMTGLDLLLRWRDPARAIYRSAEWRTEVLFARRGTAPDSALSTWGMFSTLEWQFARRWRLGGRYDRSESPASSTTETGGLAYLTFTPTEYSLLSLQGRVRKLAAATEHAAFVKATFNIGPHGLHPF